MHLDGGEDKAQVQHVRGVEGETGGGGWGVVRRRWDVAESGSEVRPEVSDHNKQEALGKNKEIGRRRTKIDRLSRSLCGYIP